MRRSANQNPQPSTTVPNPPRPKRQTPEERIDLWRPQGTTGLHVLRIEESRRIWTSYTEHYSIVVITGGAFDGFYRRKERTHEAGILKLKDPGEVHRDTRVHAPFSLQSAAFEPTLIEDIAHALGIPGPVHLKPIERGASPRATQLAFAMHKALAAPHTDPLELNTLITETLTEVLLTCADSGARSMAERAPRTVRRALDYLHQNVTEHVTLDDLADHTGTDKFHLVRAFRAEVGVPPYEYLTHLRIKRARALLARGLPGAQVAAAVGLYDESQLHRHFRRIHGITPGKFARAMGLSDAKPSAKIAQVALPRGATFSA